MNYIDAVKNYIPLCEQEERDREYMLRFIAANPDCLSRQNDTAHFTASAWIVNPQRSKVLMVYHNIYDSWSWTGGHADGEEDMCALSEKELREETGLSSPRLVSQVPVSLEILTVDGHMKRGEYVHSHLHLNLPYLFEADEDDALQMKADENSGVKWLSTEEITSAVSEKWMLENVYSKLLSRSAKWKE